MGGVGDGTHTHRTTMSSPTLGSKHFSCAERKENILLSGTGELELKTFIFQGL